MQVGNQIIDLRIQITHAFVHPAHFQPGIDRLTDLFF